MSLCFSFYDSNNLLFANKKQKNTLQKIQRWVCVCVTIHKGRCFAAVCEHKVVLSVAKLLWTAGHKHIVIPEKILQTGQLHTQREAHAVIHQILGKAAAAYVCSECVCVCSNTRHVCMCVSVREQQSR